MADDAKSPFVLYGTLAAGIAVIITAVADYKMASNPTARPDAFTGKDGDQLKQYCNQELSEVRAEITHIQQWIQTHQEWGRDINEQNERWKGRIDAEHEYFHQLLMGYQR